MLDAFFIKIVFYLSIFELGVIITSNLLDFSIKFILRSLLEFLEHLLCLKIKDASVYWLRHKTDGGMMACDMHRDLTACFTWKQAVLGFPSLFLRLA
jgi:hypothetical protein